MGWRSVRRNGAIRGRGDLGPPLFYSEPDAHVLRKLAGMRCHSNGAGEQQGVVDRNYGVL